MSVLSDKINSYVIERGWELNENVSALPTRTGTNPSTVNLTLTNAATFTNSMSAPPGGGTQSWGLAMSTLASAAGNSRFSSALTGHFAGLNDGDFSIGFWFQYSLYPTGAPSFFNFGLSSTMGASITLNGSGAGSSAGKIRLSNSGVSILSSTTVTDTNWHYIAIRRTLSPNMMYLYLDGQLVGSASSTITAVPSGNVSFGSASTQSQNYTVNVSNYYHTTSSIIGPTEIAEIWAAGSVAPATGYPLKYWNGSAWTTPISKTQWNGSAWVPLNGKVWSGTAWVDIT